MMTFKDEYDFPDGLTVLENEDLVMFQFRDIKTDWMSKDDRFISKITFLNMKDSVSEVNREESIVLNSNAKNGKKGKCC